MCAGVRRSWLWREGGAIFRRAALVGGLIGVLLSAGFPGRAAGDGDPASDALISQSVFYPYSSPVPQVAQDRLNAQVADAHRAGVDLKVALIARTADLGSITALYRQPQRYAEFLDTEISFKRRIPLLVVMPNGFGVEGLSPTAVHAILSSDPQGGVSGADLAAAASSAIARALAGSGHIASRETRVPGTGPRRAIMLSVLILAALLTAGTLIVLRVHSRAPGASGEVGGAHRTRRGAAKGRGDRLRVRSRRGG
jgi:hypothetical protein